MVSASPSYSLLEAKLLSLLQCLRQGWQYGTVRYASIFAKKYGALVWYAFFVMVRVRYVGTVRLLCDGTGTVRWYAV